MSRSKKGWLELIKCLSISALCVVSIMVESVEAQTITVNGAPIATMEEESLLVSAQFEVGLTSVLEEAMQHGIPLYFVREFELSHSRWYWLDDVVLTSSQVWRLDYHALTRQYRLSSGLFHQNVNALEDALRLLQRAQSWRVADRHNVPKGTYEARVRLRFDPSRLPTPLQLSALSQKEWTLTSEWTRWPVTF